jgi:hypothetical protein
MEQADCFRVRIVSENCQPICGYTPDHLFALNSFQSVFPSYQQSSFIAYLQQVYQTFLRTGVSDQPKCTTVSFIEPQGTLLTCCCATHFVGGDQNLFICEFEALDYKAKGKDSRQDIPVDTVATDVSGLRSQVDQSMSDRVIRQSLSKALAATEDGSLELLAVMGQIHQRFATAHTVPELLEEVTEMFQDLTKFDRCMIYEFDHLYNGCVVTERVDSRASVDSYKGLHFPASDIPEQARKLVCIAL